MDKQTSDGFSDAMLSPVNEERQQSGETDRQTDRQTYVKLTDPLEREKETFEVVSFGCVGGKNGETV